MPALSVLVPVRNAAPWLASSLASLARQTLTDHEVILIDDGSTDGSAAMLDRAAARDARLTVRHTPPLGLPAALNLALSLANAPWVARHDADDISHRHRLALQLAHLERHPTLDVLGTRIRAFPASSTGAGMRRWVVWHNTLMSHTEMECELLIDSPLTHGTAVMRRSVLESVGGWNDSGWAEDLDLWVRLFRTGARFGKLPMVLYGWRQHAASSTRTDDRYSRANFTSLKVAALDQGVLRGGRRATLVGVGSSLVRWRRALGERLRAAHEIRRPAAAVGARLEPPVVLALTAPGSRQRWRRFMTSLGHREPDDFIFVA